MTVEIPGQIRKASIWMESTELEYRKKKLTKVNNIPHLNANCTKKPIDSSAV